MQPERGHLYYMYMRMAVISSLRGNAGMSIDIYAFLYVLGPELLAFCLLPLYANAHRQ